jgi:hypothetical protein
MSFLSKFSPFQLQFLNFYSVCLELFLVIQLTQTHISSFFQYEIPENLGFYFTGASLGFFFVARLSFLDYLLWRVTTFVFFVWPVTKHLSLFFVNMIVSAFQKVVYVCQSIIDFFWKLFKWILKKLRLIHDPEKKSK